MLKDDILNVFNFKQCLLFAHYSNHRYNSGTQISAVTWRTVHKHLVADAFRSKKSSSALFVHDQQAYMYYIIHNIYIHIYYMPYI